MNTWGFLVIPSLILFGALVTDLRSRKIYNWYVIAAAVLALANSFYFFQWSGITQGLAGAGLALLLTLPLVLVGVLGAGDMKLLIVFGLGTSYSAVFAVLVASFIWAAVFGLIYAVLSGGFRRMLGNMAAITKGENAKTLKLHQIPFTVAIVIGWMTYLMQNHGVFL